MSLVSFLPIDISNIGDTPCAAAVVSESAENIVTVAFTVLLTFWLAVSNIDVMQNIWSALAGTIFDVLGVSAQQYGR